MNSQKNRLSSHASPDPISCFVSISFWLSSSRILKKQPIHNKLHTDQKDHRTAYHVKPQAADLPASPASAGAVKAIAGPAKIHARPIQPNC